MANTVHLAAQRSLFAHCTIAPNLLSRYTIDTHFETGQGTAIKGDFKGDEITLFRLNNQLNTAFITTGAIVARPKYEIACRTQIEVVLPQSAVTLLQEQPLGNHHLVLPGDQRSTLTLACKILGIDLLQ
jgi:L-fucose isomerase-like protein